MKTWSDVEKWLSDEERREHGEVENLIEVRIEVLGKDYLGRPVGYVCSEALLDAYNRLTEGHYGKVHEIPLSLSHHPSKE